MISSSRAALAASLVVVALTGTAVAAPAAATLAPSYRYTGTVDGSFEGTLQLDPTSAPNVYAVRASEVRKKQTSAWEGRATLANGHVLTIERGNGASVGITGALGGAQATVAGSREYVAVFDASFQSAQIRVYTLDAAGKGTEAGTASLETSEQLWEKAPGDLIAFAQKTLDKAVHKELDLKKDFSIGSYLNVGVETGIQLLSDSDRTPDMVEADRQFRAAGKGEPIWVRTIVEGGPTVSWSQGLPIDPAAGFNLDYGFSVGTKVRYTCEDQYKRPAGVTDAQGVVDALEALPAETFDIPFTVDKARAMAQGSDRVLQGSGSLAISGGVSVGLRLAQLGILQGTGGIDLAAGIGVHWAIAGNLQLEVTRVGAHQARVHWTQAASTDFGPNASLVIGFTIDPSAADAARNVVTGNTNIPGSIANPVVTAIVNQAGKYTQIKFAWSADWSHTNQLEVDAVYDLSNPAAKRFFEAAVRGNLTLSQELGASGPSSGVVSCKVTSTLTDAIANNTEVSVFNLLSYHDAERTAEVLIDVKTQDGTHSVTSLHEYSDDTNHLFNGEDHLSAVTTLRTVTPPSGAAVTGQRVDFVARHVDDSADGGDVAGYLATAQLLLGDAASSDLAALAPKKKGDDYGKSELDLTIALGQGALAKILAADQPTFLAAYARSFGKGYGWSPARQDQLSHVSLVAPNGHDDPETPAQRALRLEAWDYHEAKDSWDYLKKAQKTSDLARKLQALPDMAEDNGYKFHAIVALAALAGSAGPDVQVTVSIKGGKGLQLSKTAGQIAPLPTQP